MKLTGMYVHLVDNDTNRIAKQGKVVGVDRGFALVQLFSFVDGSPTAIVPITIELLYQTCLLYKDREAWISASESQMERDFANLMSKLDVEAENELPN